MQAYNASKELNYGVMEELAVPSVSAIALPLRIDKGAAYAAISIVAISSRMTDSRKPELLELLREKVEELQSRLSRN